MVIDLKKCIGCDTCTVSCKAENRTPPGVTDNVVLQNEIGAYPNVALVNLPRPCMQCDRPPCVQVCPVKATNKLDNGVVAIDYDRCIGCRYCEANLADLRRRESEAEAEATHRRRKYFQSSAGHLRKK